MTAARLMQKKIESQFSLLPDQLSHRAFQAFPDRTLRQRLDPHQKPAHKKYESAEFEKRTVLYSRCLS